MIVPVSVYFYVFHGDWFLLYLFDVSRIPSAIAMVGFFVQAGLGAPAGDVGGLTLSLGTSLALSWGPSCAAADDDYAVYSGTLGDFASHLPVPGGCTTLGATSASLPVPAGDAYFLVVPTRAGVQGSYGRDGTGAERPIGAAACLPQAARPQLDGDWAATASQ